MIADQTGSLGGMKRRDYLPFGEELLAGIGHRQPTNGYSLSQSQQPRQQFTGKERDPETNLDYFDARYYGSLYGRFTSPDEFTGGPDELYDFADNAGDNPLLYAEKGEPQSLNKYQYCYNNPLVYTDIDGHKPWDWVKAGLEIASYVPGPIGTVASVAQVGIALAEGDYKGAVAAAAGVIPGGKLIGGAVKATAKALDKIGDAAKVVDKVRDVAKFANKVEDTASTARTIGKPGASSITGVRKSVKREATYINTHASGTEYIGVGNYYESYKQGRAIAKRYNDPHVKTKSITAANRREAFKEESRQIDARGGIMGGRNPKIYNQIESPGKQYRREDGEIP
jgi:RHS repeat-associated protein